MPLSRHSIDSRIGRRLFPVLISVTALAAGAQLEVPMVPVPMTLQTLALIVCAGVFGRAPAAVGAAAYLALGMAGAPVFAEGKSAPGLDLLELPSGGYLLGFVPGALVAGPPPGRADGFLPRATRMLWAHIVVFACGVPWLASFVGLDRALTGGLWPFLPGAVLKSLLAAAMILAFRRATRRRHPS